MNKHTNELVMNTQTPPPDIFEGNTDSEIRAHRKEMLVTTCRLFGQFGFDEGLAGHVTVRDPMLADHFWVNPLGVSFKQMTIDDLLLVNEQGEVVEGSGFLNGAAFTIHSHIHRARPDVIAAAHTHSLYGKAWSSLGQRLDPITQDACAFFEDHALFDQFNGIVVDDSEGAAIAQALGHYKAAILQNHGLLTVGTTVESAAWWFITMERSCQAQLLAQAAGTPKLISNEVARQTAQILGAEKTGFFSFMPLLQQIPMR